MKNFHLKNKLLIKLANKYGTPLYVYNGDLIIQRYKELYKFIPWPQLKIFYAMKANYNPAILKLLKENGAHIDAVSPGDVLLALKVGYSSEKILFTANNITEKEMQNVKSHNILFNLGSLSELERYGKLFPRTEICLRFNPDVVAGEHKNVQTAGKDSKFGIELNKINKAKEIIKKYNLKIIGLHEHTGSGIEKTEDFVKSMKNLLSIGTKQNFPDLKFIDFGGGFKVPYHPNEKRINYYKFGKKVTEIFSNFCKRYRKKLELYFEPGKYVVAEAGYLVVKVTTLKQISGKTIIGVDSGFPQLIRPVFYNAYHHIVNLTSQDDKLKRYDIYGNICESGDCFAINCELPEIKESDLLAIQNAGAYCYSMGGVYNLRPLPAEVLVLNKKEKLVRKRLSYEELVLQIVKESVSKAY